MRVHHSRTSSDQRSSAPQSEPTNQQAPAVTARHVNLHYGQLQALEQINLHIPAGQIVAILGPNGAGKSSLINLMLGLIKPTHGKVEVLGGKAGDLPIKRRLGIMLQQAELADNLRVEEIIQLFRQYYPNPLSLKELLTIAGLNALHKRYYQQLSGGEKRRVQFALAMAGNPELIFLDEPTTGLDPEARQLLWQQIRSSASQGRTVILTTHYIEEADQLAERIIVMRSGQIIADDTPSAIKSRIQQRTIRCQTQLTPDHSFIKSMATNPNVQQLAISTHRNAYQLSFLSNCTESIVRELLKHDANLSELEIQNVNLEQAFLALTKQGTQVQTGAHHAKH